MRYQKCLFRRKSRKIYRFDSVVNSHKEEYEEAFPLVAALAASACNNQVEVVAESWDCKIVASEEEMVVVAVVDEGNAVHTVMEKVNMDCIDLIHCHSSYLGRYYSTYLTFVILA